MSFLKKHLFLIIFIPVWITMLLCFWCAPTMISGNEIGYTVLTSIIIIPLFAFSVTLKYALNGGIMKWISLAVFSLSEIMLYNLTFNLANMLANHRINMPDFGMFVYAFIPALIGAVIGMTIKSCKKYR